MSDLTGNTSDKCRWCGDRHGSLWACDPDGMRRKIRALQSELRDRDAWHQAVISEDCGQEERHCPCVPALRHEIERLLQKIEQLHQQLAAADESARMQASTSDEKIERLRAERQSVPPDPIAALETWANQEKCRSVSIAIDDGYGATCWAVTLRRGKHIVCCSETNFLAYDDVDPRWHEHEGNLYCCVQDGDSLDEWPGLAATIQYAVECAEKFWGEQAEHAKKAGGEDE